MLAHTQASTTLVGGGTDQITSLSGDTPGLASPLRPQRTAHPSLTGAGGTSRNPSTRSKWRRFNVMSARSWLRQHAAIHASFAGIGWPLASQSALTRPQTR